MSGETELPGSTPLSGLGFRRLLLRAVAVPFALLVTMAGLLVWQGRRLLDAAARVNHADRIIARIHHLERLFDDMETGVRGYLLTRDPSFLSPYDSAGREVDGAIRTIEILVSDDTAQVEAVGGLSTIFDGWRESARAAVVSPGIDLGEVHRRKGLMDEIRARADSLRATHERLRNDRATMVSDRSRRVFNGALLLLGVGGVVLLLLGRRQLRALATSYDERTRSLAESRRYLATTLRSIGDAVIATDTNGNVAQLNPVAEVLTGWTEAAARGRPLDEVFRLFDEERRERLASPLQRILATDNPGTSTRGIALLARDGTLRPISASAAPIRDGSDTLLGLVVVARDMTEQRRRESALLSAQKMEAIGRLAGGVAHDFNNLLTVIMGVSSVALDRLSSDHPLRVDLEDIRQAGERASSLTRQLLAFGRRQVMVPQVLDLNLLVRDLERMLRRVVPENIDLSLNLCAGPLLVKADPSQVEQVILNLALNARDAMPGRGKLTIETSATDLDERYARQHPGVTPREYALVAVSDTGEGMSLETQAHLFEPFFTTKEQGRGTGLGLATVHGIVRQSGGHIWVYSSRDHGTVFKVYLPLSEEVATVTTPTPRRDARRQTGSEVILVIEDEAALRRFICRILTDLGYRVLEAANGEEAVELVAGNRDIRLVLTDVVMPGLSGRALERELRRANPGPRLLFTSGYADEAIVHHGVLDEGTHFIQKPFTAANLAAKIRAVLDEP